MTEATGTLTLNGFATLFSEKPGRIRGLKQRRQFPFPFDYELEEFEGEAAYRWARYTVDDALCYQCALNFSENNGMDFVAASAIVLSSSWSLFFERNEPQEDFHIICAEFVSTRDIFLDRCAGRFAGNFSEVADYLRRNPEQILVRCFMTSVTLAYRQIQERARSLNLEIVDRKFRPMVKTPPAGKKRMTHK